MKERLNRIGWFVLLWVASVLTLSIVAYGIRWALSPALSA